MANYTILYIYVLVIDFSNHGRRLFFSKMAWLLYLCQSQKYVDPIFQRRS